MQLKAIKKKYTINLFYGYRVRVINGFEVLSEAYDMKEEDGKFLVKTGYDFTNNRVERSPVDALGFTVVQ